MAASASQGDAVAASCGGSAASAAAWSAWKPSFAASAERHPLHGHGGFKGKGKGKGGHSQPSGPAWLWAPRGNTYVEHPSVRNRSELEVEEWRTDHAVAIVEDGGERVPKPIISLAEAPFPDWAISELIRKGLTAPTAVQAQAWPTATVGRDVVGIAETGSGKTLAYLLPLVLHALSRAAHPRAGPRGLVVTLTRELANQTFSVLAPFARAGGFGIALDCGADIPAGTAVLVAAAAHDVNLMRYAQDAAVLAIDEADALVEGNGAEGCTFEALLSGSSAERQLLLFSATWPEAARRISLPLLRSHVLLHVGTTGVAACHSITQYFEVLSPLSKTLYMWDAMEKVDAVLSSGEKLMIFCGSAEAVGEVVLALASKGWPAIGVHEAFSDEHRADAISRFRRDLDEYVLVTTSFLGRGLDFPNVCYVINYDMPARLVEYVHRIGRCGRLGSQGYSLTLLTLQDVHAHSQGLVRLLKASGQEVPRDLGAAAKNGGIGVCPEELRWAWGKGPSKGKGKGSKPRGRGGPPRASGGLNDGWAGYTPKSQEPAAGARRAPSGPSPVGGHDALLGDWEKYFEVKRDRASVLATGDGEGTWTPSTSATETDASPLKGCDDLKGCESLISGSRC